jgi:membrane-associated phospholipid phosphatase
MFSFEWVAVCFGIILAAVSLARRRVAALVSSLALVGGVFVASRWTPLLVRESLPIVYLLAGYWIPGLVVGRESPRRQPALERWLAGMDRRAAAPMPRVPEVVIEVLELAYLFCYPLVPACLLLLLLRATDAAIERFWTSVLVSGYACYGTLPWLVMYPPRRTGTRAGTPGAIRRLNVLVLGRASHGWTTFPSGHVAVSYAAAVSLWHVWPQAGIVVALVAAGVAAGAVAGRYHYALDVAAGFVLAAGVTVITW